MIKHDLGETCVPLNPKRIVVLGGLDSAIALGVKPIGAEGRIQPYFESFLSKADLETIEPIGFEETDANLEVILKLKPDLILQESLGRDFQMSYQILSKIAPTVVVIRETDADWKPGLLKFAEALGKSKQADQLLVNYEAHLAEFKKKMGDRLNQTTVSLVRVYTHSVSFYLKTSFPGSVIAEAGLKRPPMQDVTPIGTNQVAVNSEMIQILESDIMFIWTYGHVASIAEAAQEALKRLQSNALWSTLRVVQRQQVHEVPSESWFGDGLIAANLVVDDLFKYFLE